MKINLKLRKIKITLVERHQLGEGCTILFILSSADPACPSSTIQASSRCRLDRHATRLHRGKVEKKGSDNVQREADFPGGTARANMCFELMMTLLVIEPAPLRRRAGYN